LLLVVLGLGLILTLLSDTIVEEGRRANNFLRVGNLVPNVLTPMAGMAIMALGATVVIIAGGIDISVGSICGLSALGTVWALQNFPQDASAWAVLPVALIVPLGIGLLCGLMNGLLVVALRLHPFIVTLGTLSIFRGIALVAPPVNSLPDIVAGKTVPLAFTRHLMAWKVGQGWTSMPLQPVPLMVMVLCLVVVWVYLHHTVGGRQIYAVGGNEEAARYSGLPVGRIKVRAFALSGLAAGIAGMVSAGYEGSAQTQTGMGSELTVIAAAVVGGASLTGGRGTALGAVLGALVIQLIENGIFVLREVHMGALTLRLKKEYTMIVTGIAIIIAVAVDRLSEYLRQRPAAGRRQQGAET